MKNFKVMVMKICVILFFAQLFIQILLRLASRLGSYWLSAMVIPLTLICWCCVSVTVGWSVLISSSDAYRRSVTVLWSSCSEFSVDTGLKFWMNFYCASNLQIESVLVSFVIQFRITVLVVAVELRYFAFFVLFA